MKYTFTTLSLVLLGSNACLADLTDLDDARELWYSHTDGMPTDYSFVFSDEMNGTGGMEYKVDVRQGIVTNIVPTDASSVGSTVSKLDFMNIQTVEDLFDFISTEERSAVSLSTNFDEMYGYPTSVSITYTDESTLTMGISAMTPYTILQNELYSMQRLWQSFKLTGYQFTSQAANCACDVASVPPNLIQVEDETVVFAFDLNTGMPSGYSNGTFQDMFSRIQTAITNFDDQIFVSYNAILGYPNSISINPNYGTSRAAISIALSNVLIQRSDGKFVDWNGDS